MEPIASTSIISTNPIEISSSTSTSTIIPSTSTSDTTIPTTEPLDPTLPPPLSKKGAKKLAKQIAWDAGKGERKLKEKAKVAQKKIERKQAIADGTLEPVISKKHQRVLEGTQVVKSGVRIVLDMGFDELMSDKEIKSIDKQLGFCYNINRNSIAPVELLVTSLNGKLKQRMDVVSKGTHLKWKNIEWWEDSYEKLWEEESVDSTTSDSTPSTSTFNPTTTPQSLGLTTGEPQSRVPKSSIVYLTGDSPNVLTELLPTETYILGGIVDKNRHKLLCYNQAERQGIRHAQLPIGENLPDMLTRKILTVNQVFDIMVGWCETKDWKEVMTRVMPTRKFAVDSKKARRSGGRDGGEGEEKKKKKKKEKVSTENGVYIVNLDDDEDDEEDDEYESEAENEDEKKVVTAVSGDVLMKDEQPEAEVVVAKVEGEKVDEAMEV